MTNITVFHHERADGGRRTGVYVGELRGLDFYVEGSDDRDPALRWYFDLVCKSKKPPKTQTECVRWLTENRDSIENVLRETSASLNLGIDPDGLPWIRECRSPIGPIKISLYAQKRFDALAISKRIDQFLKKDWLAFLKDTHVESLGV